MDAHRDVNRAQGTFIRKMDTPWLSSQNIWYL